MGNYFLDFLKKKQDRPKLSSFIQVTLFSELFLVFIPFYIGIYSGRIALFMGFLLFWLSLYSYILNLSRLEELFSCIALAILLTALGIMIKPTAPYTSLGLTDTEYKQIQSCLQNSVTLRVDS